jgi:hypothetical protein
LLFRCCLLSAVWESFMLSLLIGAAASVTLAEPWIISPSDPALAAVEARAYLGRGVWRDASGGGEVCARAGNFQHYRFETGAATSEAGYGAPGLGEALPITSLALQGDYVAVSTQVCAPIGCSKTQERYRILGPDRFQEWDFVGRDGDHAPYEVVRNGVALHAGPARTFERCPG